MEGMKIVTLLFTFAVCQLNAIDIKYLTFTCGSWYMKEDLTNLLKAGKFEGFTFARVENYKLVNWRFGVADAVFTFKNQDDALTPLEMGKILKKQFPNKYLHKAGAPGWTFKMGIAVPRLYEGTVAAYKDNERLPYNTNFSKISDIREKLTLLLFNKIEHDTVPQGGLHFALVNKIYHQDMFYDSQSNHIMDFKMVLYSVGSTPVLKWLIETNVDREVDLEGVTYGIKLTKWQAKKDFETPDPFCKENYLVSFTAEETDDVNKIGNLMMILMNKATIGNRNMYTTFTPGAVFYGGDQYKMRLRSHCGLSDTPGSTYEEYWKRSEKMLIKNTPIKSLISVTKQ